MVKFCVVLVMVFWASAFVGIRYAVLEYHPFELALFRFLVASMTLLVLAVITKIRLPEIADMGRFLAAGTTGICVYNMALNYGELTSTAGDACFIVNTAPLFTTLLGVYFLKEKIRYTVVGGLIISFSGVSLIAVSFSSGMALNAGSLFVLAAAVSQALYFVLQKPLLNRYTPIEVTCYCLWMGTIAMLPFGYRFFEKITIVPPAYTITVIYLGIFPAAVAYWCWAVVLKHMDASKAAALLYAIPAIVILIGWIWLDELPHPLSITGGLIAMAGVAVANKKTNTEPEPIPSIKGNA